MIGVAGYQSHRAVEVVIGVDTHKDQHVAVATDGRGVRLGERHVPATTSGYEELQQWCRSLGEIRAFGIEGTSSYGAGVARFMTGRGHTVIEVNRPDRSVRYRKGKSDPADAEMTSRGVLAVAAGTGDVLMARLREGRANTARGAGHFLRETVGRVRYTGAKGQLTVRADSGFYTHAVVSACRQLDVRFSITIRQHASLRELIEAIPEQDWTPIPYWMDGAADVAETTYTPSRVSPTPHRCGSSSGG